MKSVFPKKLRKKFKRFGQDKFKSGGKFVSFRSRKSDEKFQDKVKKGEITCYKCKKPGHISRNCRSSRQDEAFKVNTVVETEHNTESESDDLIW